MSTSLSNPSGAVTASSINTALTGSPAVLRLLGMPSTPDNNGLVVDRTNTTANATQTTASLNTWAQACIANGDQGFLAAGQYPTNGEVVISGTGSTSGSTRGSGPQSCVIRPTGQGYNGVRLNITGEFQKKGVIGNFGVKGAGRPAIGAAAASGGGKIGIVMDATTLLALRDTEVSGFDIGYDFINNSYNSSLHSPSVPRFSSANVGINIREGSQNGSDMNFYDANISAYAHAVCAKGGGGGYAFFGGQWGSLLGSSDPALTPDAAGTIMLGWDYVNQTQYDGLVDILFDRIGIEGPSNTHMIRVYGEVFAKFDMCSFLASGTNCLDVIKVTGGKNGKIFFRECTAGGSYANAALASIDNSYGVTVLDETDWYIASAGVSAAGASLGQWLPTLGWQSGLKYGKGSVRDVLILSDKMIKSAGGNLVSSTDGTNYYPLSAIDTPITDSTTARTVSGTDYGRKVYMTNAAANVVTFPTGLTVGANGSFTMMGAGQTSFAAASGVSINPSTTLKVAGRYITVAWEVSSTNTILLTGALSA